MKPEEGKTIVDVCCGGRMFWFDKSHQKTLFLDNRTMPPQVVGHGIHQRVRKCEPDQVMDFRSLDLPDNYFSMVVFDPPHLFLGKNSHTAKVYGSLDKETWKDDLTKGFLECFRVLKPGGFLTFKWCEYNIPLKDILALTPEKPLFGHKSGKAQLTHWVMFMKAEEDSGSYLTSNGDSYDDRGSIPTH